jgi:hypothetical protein
MTDYHDHVRIEKIEKRLADLENGPAEVFGRNFRIGMFILGLAFVTVAGHWGIAMLGYFALKDVIFRRDDG